MSKAVKFKQFLRKFLRCLLKYVTSTQFTFTLVVIKVDIFCNRLNQQSRKYFPGGVNFSENNAKFYAIYRTFSENSRKFDSIYVISCYFMYLRTIVANQEVSQITLFFCLKNCGRGIFWTNIKSGCHNYFWPDEEFGRK